MVVRLFVAFNAHWEKILKHVSEIRQRQVLKKRGKKIEISQRKDFYFSRGGHSSIILQEAFPSQSKSQSCHEAAPAEMRKVPTEPGKLEAAVRKVSQASAGPAFTNGCPGARISRSRADQSMWPCGPREASQTDPLGLYPWVRLTTDPGKPALRIICTCWGNSIKNKIFSYTRKPLHKVVETENRCVSE